MNDTEAQLNVVICMDTEGPCDDPKKSDILKTWVAVDGAMDKLFSSQFRESYIDDFGRGPKFGWFFLNWTGFNDNPRNRDFGYHKVRDHYLSRYSEKLKAYGDEQAWHYHHPSSSRIANEWGLDWDENSEYENVLSRQILDRGFFPVSYRSGGTIMSNQQSRWLDKWIPYDFSNRSPLQIQELVDWTAAPADWSVYRPSNHSYCIPGDGRRYIARTLDLKTNVYQITNNDIREAFSNAILRGQGLISVFEHDYRDIEENIKGFLHRVMKIREEYPSVKVGYATPKEAISSICDLSGTAARLSLEAAYDGGELRIWSSEPIFQQCPWICFEDSNGNLTTPNFSNVNQLGSDTWAVQIPRKDSIRTIGIAASTLSGLSDTFTVDIQKNLPEQVQSFQIDSHPQYPNWLEPHSVRYPYNGVLRWMNSGREMDSITQLREILELDANSGKSVLEVGCCTGFAGLRIEELGFQYFGLDRDKRSVELGNLLNKNKPKRLYHLDPFHLSENFGSYDIVFDLSFFRYVASPEKYFAAITRCVKDKLIIRSPSFGEEDELRWYPDVLLADGFEDLRSTFNVFSRCRIKSILKSLGFHCEYSADWRQKETFGNKEEVVGGIPLFYSWLIAERGDSKKDALTEYAAYIGSHELRG